MVTLISVSATFVLAPQAVGAELVYLEGAPLAAAQQPCEQLAQLALPNTTITSAQTVAPGAFSPPPTMAPWMAGDPNFYKSLPAFCRVTAEDKPTPDSDIKIEVWLPPRLLPLEGANPPGPVP